MKQNGKVVELFNVSWGTIAVVDFFKPTVFKLEDELKNAKNYSWKITGIAKSKLLGNKKYQDTINSVYVWDCTIEPINHSETPRIGEELTLIRSGERDE